MRNYRRRNIYVGPYRMHKPPRWAYPFRSIHAPRKPYYMAPMLLRRMALVTGKDTK